MKLLNLGCGNRYHKSWINIDFVSKSGDIMAYNLLKGIPFDDNFFNVVYHCHLLEHFSKSQAVGFIEECYRVLKPKGVIRVGIPDLEAIVNNYQKYLRLALKGNKKAEANYDWIMLEMYDQCVRNISGGEMGKIYSTGNVSDPGFIYKRTGIKIAENYLHKLIIFPFTIDVINRILKFILGKGFEYHQLGKFRLSGEVHQWMYDRFSLARLLQQAGFKEIRVCSTRSSSITKWNSYYLDINRDGTVYKPDSIFIEAVK